MSLKNGYSQSKIKCVYPWIFNARADLAMHLLPLVFGIGYFAVADSLGGTFAKTYGLLLIVIAHAHQGSTWFHFLDIDNRKSVFGTVRGVITWFGIPALLIAFCTFAIVYRIPGVLLVISLWTAAHYVQQNIGMLLLHRTRFGAETFISRKFEALTQWLPAICCLLLCGKRLGETAFRNSAVDVALALLCTLSAASTLIYVARIISKWLRGFPLNIPAAIFWLASVLFFVPSAMLGKSWYEALIIAALMHQTQYIFLHVLLVRRKYPEARIPSLGVAFGRPPSGLQQYLLVVSFAVLILLSPRFIYRLPFDHTDLWFQLLLGIQAGVLLSHNWWDSLLWRFRNEHNRDRILRFIRPEWFETVTTIYPDPTHPSNETIPCAVPNGHNHLS